ncbi:odorant receptor 13a-like [Odontomachus brunneus]|uniref:odorant receptor 13a-like n=1 Tax=Odontomachus brunneus TaxID=486640 RepID=UPI0013F1D42A|nr:odorant receptor 13a-like [Odontomachus brunneus]
MAEWKRLVLSWRVHISPTRSPKNSTDLVLPAFPQSQKVMSGDHVVRYHAENIRHNMEEEKMQSQECISDEYDNFIKPIRMVSKLISIWPLEKYHTAKASFLKNCHLIGLFFVLLLASVTETADVIYHNDDLDELTECALICSAFYLSVIRLIIYTLHRKDLQYVVEIMREDWITSSYEDVLVLREKCIFAFRLAKCFIIMVIANIIMFACVPILEIYILGAKEKLLPFRGYFFVNQTVTPVYQCLYVFNVIAGSSVGATISSVTSFTLIAITHGSAKFAVLRKRLEAMSSNDFDIKKVVVDCVKRHQDAIAFADALERLINVLALGQFIISTGLVCFAGFQITSMLENKGRLIKYSTFLNAAIVELFMFSFSGNNLITESEAVGESAYSSGWIGGTFGRSLQIVMLRSTVPSRITAAKFYSMSLESFAQVLSTSFSYLMVLKATSDE